MFTWVSWCTSKVSMESFREATMIRVMMTTSVMLTTMLPRYFYNNAVKAAANITVVVFRDGNVNN